jgi:hypothetical protein
VSVYQADMSVRITTASKPTPAQMMGEQMFPRLETLAKTANVQALGRARLGTAA